MSQRPPKIGQKYANRNNPQAHANFREIPKTFLPSVPAKIAAKFRMG
jgi:hypothetical protein